MERRLTAILVADVVGYSRLSQTDEEGTRARFQTDLREIFEPRIVAYRGRLIKTMGDGLLVEFPSVVDALRCAVEIQQEKARRNAAAAPEQRLDFRIGVNLGDVIVEAQDIHGDGVNVAARLESLAEPGGICVASIVNESVGSRIDVKFDDGGEVSVKNIDRPIHVWKWHPTDANKGGSAPTAFPPTTARSALPSLAVLPFQNLSGDAEQEYFADGVVEDLITAFSRFKSFAVIARNSSFVYKGRSVDVRQVGRDLEVRYVLEGSVRRAGSRLRISAQLVDAVTGAHLWARNFDGAVADIFDVQDQITESVVAVVEPQIRYAELERSRQKRPESLDAYDLYLRARPNIHSPSAETSAAAIALLDRAIALDPGYAIALAAAAWAHEHRTSNGWPDVSEDDRQQGLQLARAALAVAGDDALVLAHCGAVMQALGRDYDQSQLIFKRAVKANPNDATVLTIAGFGQLLGGSLEEALALFERVIRLNPRDTSGAMTGIAHAQMCLGHYEEALDWAGRSLAENPNTDWTYWVLIAGNAYLGRLDEAKRVLAALQKLVVGVSLSRIRQYPKDPRRIEVLIEGMRLAGMPET